MSLVRSGQISTSRVVSGTGRGGRGPVGSGRVTLAPSDPSRQARFGPDREAAPKNRGMRSDGQTDRRRGEGDIDSER